MEFRHIRAFMAIAEEGSFTRAAIRLGIAQPPLSVQIRQLETEIGGPLFKRLAHGVELTQTGSVFRQVAGDLAVRAERGLEAARRVAQGRTGVFALGYTASAIFNALVAGTIATFRRTHPDVELRLEEANTQDLLNQLRQGILDAAFLRPTSGDVEGLSMVPLPSERLVAVIPRDHPRANDPSIALADLAAEPLLLYPRKIGPELFDIVVAACRDAGFEPILGQTTPQIASIIHLVAAGLGIAIVPRSMTQLVPPSVTFKDLAECGLAAPLAYAWLDKSTSPTVANMATLLGRSEELRGS